MFLIIFWRSLDGLWSFQFLFFNAINSSFYFIFYLFILSHFAFRLFYFYFLYVLFCFYLLFYFILFSFISFIPQMVFPGIYFKGCCKTNFFRLSFLFLSISFIYFYLSSILTFAFFNFRLKFKKSNSINKTTNPFTSFFLKQLIYSIILF